MLLHLKTSWCLWSYAELYLNTLGCHNTISINVAKYDLQKLYLREGALPFGKQRWQWKMNLLKMYSLLNMGIFHGYLTLPECIFLRILVVSDSDSDSKRHYFVLRLDCGDHLQRSWSWYQGAKRLRVAGTTQGKMIRERNCYRFLVVKLQLCKSWLIWNDG